jgi:hypothetical protein
MKLNRPCWPNFRMADKPGVISPMPREEGTDRGKRKDDPTTSPFNVYDVNVFDAFTSSALLPTRNASRHGPYSW